jgi:hypothetical protein
MLARSGPRVCQFWQSAVTVLAGRIVDTPRSVTVRSPARIAMIREWHDC